MSGEPLPRAVVVHRTTRRLRLRFPSKRGDTAFFTRLMEHLAELEAIHHVTANPGTASVLLEHDGLEPESLADSGTGWALFELVDREEPEELILDSFADQFRDLDRRMRRFTGGAADSRSAVMLIFLALGLLQLARGQVMAPASSLLWYAFQLIAADRAGGPPRDLS
jgi:hypothetical protein